MKMKLGLLGLAALLLAAAAPLSQGDPVQNRVVAITWCCIGHAGDDAEEDEGVPLTVSGTTDRSGSVLLSAQPGRYALKLPNVQTLRVPAVARIEVGRTVLTTNTIQPGGRGDAYFMGRDGRRLTFMVPRGARVRVVLTEGAPAPGPTGEGGTGDGRLRIGDGSNRDHIDQDAQSPDRVVIGLPTGTPNGSAAPAGGAIPRAEG